MYLAPGSAAPRVPCVEEGHAYLSELLGSNVAISSRKEFLGRKGGLSSSKWYKYGEHTSYLQGYLSNVSHFE